MVNPREDKLFGEPHFADNDNRIKMVTTLNATVLLGIDSNGKARVVDVFDTDGRIKVSTRPQIVAETTNNTLGAALSFPTDTDRYIVGIRAEAVMDVNVANRVMTLVVTPQPPLILGTIAAIAITGPTLSASQSGSISLFAEPSTWLNDNGVVTRQADTNPLPMFLDSTSIFVVDLTNIQIGDQIALRMYYTEQ